MFKRAQDMLELVQDGVKTTLRVVADLAESVGVPPAVTALIQPNNTADQWKIREMAPSTAAPVPAVPQPAPVSPPVVMDAPANGGRAMADVEDASADVEDNEMSADASFKADKAKMTSKRRPVVGDRDRSKGIRALAVDDAIEGSTYLARIIWSLGVAELEGIGPLRPADIARMVMSRSAVSLEPPNVARYIRRSKPTTIAIAHSEGGSSFYQLNAQGQKLFREYFALN